VSFAIEFFLRLGEMLLDAAPVLIPLLLVIVGLAILIGRGEGWSLGNSIYYGLVTATTVGYGDFRPARPAGKAMAIVIAFLGLIQIGIIVALAVQAVTESYDLHGGLWQRASPGPSGSGEQDA
jgi:voltage-gated potassium channel Kch